MKKVLPPLLLVGGALAVIYLWQSYRKKAAAQLMANSQPPVGWANTAMTLRPLQEASMDGWKIGQDWNGIPYAVPDQSTTFTYQL